MFDGVLRETLNTLLVMLKFSNKVGSQPFTCVHGISALKFFAKLTG